MLNETNTVSSFESTIQNVPTGRSKWHPPFVNWCMLRLFSHNLLSAWCCETPCTTKLSKLTHSNLHCSAVYWSILSTYQRFSTEIRRWNWKKVAIKIKYFLEACHPLTKYFLGTPSKWKLLEIIWSFNWGCALSKKSD